MEDTPKEPKDEHDHPTDEHAPGGIPKNAGDDEPKGQPGGRHETETVANRSD